ncbi:WecB/TagA/CpsF family glycosyltransferase [Rhizobiaceae bacterium n13]|uniref:WecB/TagA/CpsF family glycosyltransferase n=1 Tax=Ferirhizobium litorale TaxID=2927786 RepID=A0AAE3QFR4_9HYPH|nr:WecB/TagA/CpsF family glycosyltransferase [Fererhizobium litorale]MDI7863430.1 WecB/TagA/CpsF family glycosyltransferase [Fererhizobium litorale]MDI7922293.1 WecB/TagA/CpsF family glycosyltransferase [Fererhizobium litorale]
MSGEHAVRSLPPQRSIFGLPVSDLDWNEALAFADAQAGSPSGQKVISFLNAHNANLMLKDGAYREVLSRHVVLSDGIGVDIAARVMHGSPFPANLNGTDFVPALLTYMVESRRIGLIGARPAVLARAVEAFRAHAPWHEFIAVSHGYHGEAASKDVAALVARLKLDVLIVGMGTPIQEKWVDRYIGREHARLVLTVGALFDFVAGVVPRAPRLVRKLRLEWAYRLLQEPRRLWRRYVLGIPSFLLNVLRHRLVGEPEPVFAARIERPAEPSSVGGSGIDRAA